MSTLEQIEAAWAVDAEINQLQLGEEAARISKLHSKYHAMLAREIFALESITQKLAVLERDLMMYFSNRLTDEETAALGLEPNERKLIGGPEKQSYVDTHPLIIKEKKLYTMQKAKVDLLKSIIDSVNGRNWVIKNIIDWRRFKNGEN